MVRSRGKHKSLTARAEAAFKEASKELIKRARQTGTPVIVWKDGHIEEIPGEQVEMPTAQT